MMGNRLTGTFRLNSGPLDQRLYAAQDANHNVTALIDTSGAVVERYEYDPYGKATVLDANWAADSDGISDVGWAYLHQGGRYDAATGLYYFRMRDYSPILGRWLEQDPIGYIDGMSLYQPMGSNPLNRSDPTGLSTFSNCKVLGLTTMPYVRAASPGARDAAIELQSVIDLIGDIKDAADLLMFATKYMTAVGKAQEEVVKDELRSRISDLAPTIASEDADKIREAVMQIGNKLRESDRAAGLSIWVKVQCDVCDDGETETRTEWIRVDHGTFNRPSGAYSPNGITGHEAADAIDLAIDIYKEKLE